MSSSRTFDLTITKLKDDASVTFGGIEKEEQKNLISYFKSKNVKIRVVDVESNEHVVLEEDEDSEEEEKQGPTRGPTGRIIKPTGAADQLGDDYDSEEDDEDFEEDASPEASESEDDEEMQDEELDKEEVEDL